MISKNLRKIWLIGVMVCAFVLSHSPFSYAFKHKVSEKRQHKTSQLAASKSSAKKNSSRKTSSKKKKIKQSSKKKSSKKLVLTKKPAAYNPDTAPALEDDVDDIPVEKEVMKVSDLVQKYVTPNQTSMSSETINRKEKVIMSIIHYMDTPYRYGGNTENGIDCSAFTRSVYNNTFSMELPRSAREQYQIGETIDRSGLKFGDLVFFNTRRRVRPGHVGIYIGDNLFAHASSRQGVMVSSLDSEYYAKRFMGGRRVNSELVSAVAHGE